MKRLTGTRDDAPLLVGAAALVGGFLVLLGLGVDRLNFDVLSGAMTVVVLLLVFIPILRWIGRVDGDPWIARVLIWALFAKFAFTLVRYFVIERVYSGEGDAGLYAWGGKYLAEHYVQGIFTTDVPVLASRGPETLRIAVIVGLIYVVTGYSIYAAFFVFASISFWGQVLMLRAMRRAVPNADHRHYTLLVMFIPSLLFWPSSVGKEAVMIGCIGLVSYGAANILGDKARLRGFLVFGLGVAILFLFRPHMGMIAVVALGIASTAGVIGGFRSYGSNRAFAIRFGALVLLVASASLLTTQLSRFFEQEGASDEGGVASVLDRTQEMTSTGGSEFSPVAVRSPLDLPAAAVTVLFRPFPWEAGNLNGIVAGAEGLLLLGILVAGRRRLLSWVRALPRSPYLIFALTYMGVFIVAFSYISNFGILARQRTQMLPLALTLLALHPAVRTRVSWFGRKPDAPDLERADGSDEGAAGASQVGVPQRN